jgi:hypothetical protein
MERVSALQVLSEHIYKSWSASMTRFIWKLTFPLAASAVMQISLFAIASAQQTIADPTVKQERAPAAGLRTTGTSAGGVPGQNAARAAHPITQGGTTGGTVNPGVNGDHKQHGYNGG